MCFNSNAFADNQSKTWFSARLGGLALGGKFWLNRPGVSFTGYELELSLKLPQQIVVETFGQRLFEAEDPGFSFGTRLGYLFPSFNQTGTFKGYLTPLLGYAYTHHPVSGEGPLFNATHSLQSGGAVDVHMSDDLALTARLLFLFEYALSSEKVEPESSWIYYGDELYSYGVHVGLLIGFTWR